MSEHPIYVDPFPADWIQRWAVYSMAAFNNRTGILDTSVNMAYVHVPPIDNPNEDPSFALQIRDMLRDFALQTYPLDQGWVGHAVTHAILMTGPFAEVKP